MRILFVTGRLAEGLTRQVIAEVSAKSGFAWEVQVVGISVAALLHVDWLKRKLTIPGKFDRVIVPGWCQGDLRVLETAFGIPFTRGPKDVRDLGTFLGNEQQPPPDLSRYDIEILAEINHAPQLSEQVLVRQALDYRAAGADVIDLGCVPGGVWKDAGQAVRRLREAGLRVSIDSFERDEVELAVAAGAELVLSCNRSNVEWAAALDVEFVVIPDDPSQLETMWETASVLRERGRPFRLDPILEPIGFGFAASLARYQATRKRDVSLPIMMGIGNVTELSEVDSAGINFLLAAICQEQQIHSVLTTQVINWCRSSVAEFDKARRLVKYAIDNQTPPKRVNSELVLLRDAKVSTLGDETLRELSGQLKDPNYRIFVERGEIHVMNRDGYWRGRDAYELFDQFSIAGSGVDPSHAFYLGYELSKAVTALTLGKQYRQDEALQWGFLTMPEPSAHERRHRQRPVPGEPT
ncbi:DUF6513 domain-containing protein [Planctomicrobium piriforme]|uniref:DUF6513 domain-containing protein n=1 Tax=Planctomicrobium piriforme TaxID=1576369 RepID=UPI001C316CBB|nr:DUF6513 domain-containing protein [Planctomicrobium piriforme]